MEEAYQSGKLQDRIAPCCYGAFEGNNIDVLMNCPYHRECFEPLGYLDAQRNVLRRSRCYVHWIFMIGGPIEVELSPEPSPLGAVVIPIQYHALWA